MPYKTLLTLLLESNETQLGRVARYKVRNKYLTQIAQLNMP